MSRDVLPQHRKGARHNYARRSLADIHLVDKETPIQHLNVLASTQPRALWRSKAVPILRCKG